MAKEQDVGKEQGSSAEFLNMGLTQYVWLSYAPMSQPLASPPPGRGRPR